MSRALSTSQLQQVIKGIVKHYPAAYADSAWDNTGLHIDCSVSGEGNSKNKPKILLTVDLTSSVAQEAIDNGCNLILSYHPFIFPSWKNIVPAKNPQHQSALKLIQNGISVYCPHTAVDGAKGGVNDWLVDGLTKNSQLIKSSTSIEKISSNKLVGQDNEDEVGYGRLVKFSEPVSLDEIVRNVKASLNIEFLQVATLNKKLSDHKIKSVALCAGSGSGVFKELKESVDLYYTGELSHHEVLRYKETGKAVIVCNHSNTERGFLKDVMIKQLEKEGFECLLSETDTDPLKTY